MSRAYQLWAGAAARRVYRSMRSWPGAFAGRRLLTPTPISRTGSPSVQFASSRRSASARMASACRRRSGPACRPGDCGEVGRPELQRNRPADKAVPRQRPCDALRHLRDLLVELGSGRDVLGERLFGAHRLRLPLRSDGRGVLAARPPLQRSAPRPERAREPRDGRPCHHAQRVEPCRLQPLGGTRADPRQLAYRQTGKELGLGAGPYDDEPGRLARLARDLGHRLARCEAHRAGEAELHPNASLHTTAETLGPRRSSTRRASGRRRLRRSTSAR